MAYQFQRVKDSKIHRLLLPFCAKNCHEQTCPQSQPLFMGVWWVFFPSFFFAEFSRDFVAILGWWFQFNGNFSSPWLAMLQHVTFLCAISVEFSWMENWAKRENFYGMSSKNKFAFNSLLILLFSNIFVVIFIWKIFRYLDGRRWNHLFRVFMGISVNLTILPIFCSSSCTLT